MTYMEPLSLTNGKFSYDAESDALFIRIPGDYRFTIEQRNFNIDIDTKGNIIAVEILDASKVLGISQEVLENHDHWECHVDSKGKNITIELSFSVSTDSKVNARLSEKAKKAYPETRMIVSA